jgi:hypothetical protein
MPDSFMRHLTPLTRRVKSRLTRFTEKIARRQKNIGGAICATRSR